MEIKVCVEVCEEDEGEEEEEGESLMVASARSVSSSNSCGFNYAKHTTRSCGKN